VEQQGKCTAACEPGAERSYEETTPTNKKGKVCVGPTDCQPGEDECPSTGTTVTSTTNAIPLPTSSKMVPSDTVATPSTAAVYGTKQVGGMRDPTSAGVDDAPGKINTEGKVNVPAVGTVTDCTTTIVTNATGGGGVGSAAAARCSVFGQHVFARGC
jgi:hypothetical protein